MSEDIYTPRFMIEAIKQAPPLYTFLKSTFFRSIKTFPTTSVEFDVKKGGMAMAPFVSPRNGSTSLERGGYKTYKYTPPLVAPKRVLTLDDIDRRLPGEAVYNGYSPIKRRMELLTEDLLELDNSITRREEWMCAKALFEGEIPIIGEGVNEIIKFPFTNKEILTGADLWSNDASKPLKKLKEATKVVARSGHSPNIAIFSSDSIDAFIEHPDVQKKLDIRNFNLGVIKPEILGNGATYYGYLPEIGLYIYSYDGFYSDTENINPEYPDISVDSREFIPAVYPLVPEGNVLIASTKMPCKMLYGIVNDIQIGSFMEARVPKIWDQQEPSERYIKISSRPLPTPMELDAYYVLQVL